jgi:hypothetical protein
LVFERLILIYLDVEVWLSLKSAQMRWWIGSTISSKLDSHGDRFGPHTAFWRLGKIHVAHEKGHVVQKHLNVSLASRRMLHDGCTEDPMILT